MTPKVSIIVPVYNVEPYIKRCLESLLLQNYDNYEIIVVNDGSSDNSLQVCKQIQDPKIKVYTKENEGVSKTRNFGLTVCDKSSEFVFFVDSDDTVSSQYISSLVRFSSIDTLSICDINNCTEEYTDDQIRITYKVIHYNDIWNNKPFIELFQKGLINSVCNKCFSLPLIRKYGLTFQSTLPEDTYFNIAYLEKVKKVMYIKMPLYNYIHRGSSLSSFPKKIIFDNYIDIQKKLKINIDPALHTLIDSFVYPQYISNILKYIKVGEYSIPKLYLSNNDINQSIKAYKPIGFGDHITHFLLKHKLLHILKLL